MDSPRSFVEGLYGELLELGTTYFLPESRLTVLGPINPANNVLTFSDYRDGALELDWLGFRYALSNRGKPLTEDQRKLIRSIGRVLSARYQFLFQAPLAAHNFELFRGLAEDRYISAFLDPAPYASPEPSVQLLDRVADAIEVLRVSSLSTYENRRISTGVLLFGSLPDPCHVLPPRPSGALRYSSALTSIKSFHRLCDGLHTVALVDQQGLLVELVNVEEWARPFGDIALPVPSPSRYQGHSRATLCGGHICLVLSPNGEIKVFAQGVEVFNFLDGRWRLTDVLFKYSAWQQALGGTKLAERLFTVALNLAENRRGGLFVVLDRAELAGELVTPCDLLNHEPSSTGGSGRSSKEQLHYLLRHSNLLELAPAILESVARIDGGIVLDREGNLLAFGAILRHRSDYGEAFAEGGRTTAAIGASHFGSVLKVSEDGMVSFYQSGQCVWEI